MSEKSAWLYFCNSNIKLHRSLHGYFAEGLLGFEGELVDAKVQFVNSNDVNLLQDITSVSIVEKLYIFFNFSQRFSSQCIFV